MPVVVRAVEALIRAGNGFVFRNVMVIFRRLVPGLAGMIHPMRDGYCGRGSARGKSNDGNQKAEAKRIAHEGVNTTARCTTRQNRALGEYVLQRP
jgi:hypothetical protein